MTDRLQKKINDKQIHFIEDGIPSRWDEKSMTHDELLNTLDDLAVYNSGYAYIFEALRAVVELHTPNGYHHANVCDVCDAIYPCPTIQAIEKELG